MALYRFEVKAISKGKGLSAVGAAAYRSGQRLWNHEGQLFDYANKSDVLETKIFAPETAPAWIFDRETLWQRVEQNETRANARLARELIISLPHELKHEDHRQMITRFVSNNLLSLGMVADVAWHHPHKGEEDRNVHAHILITNRPLNGEGFAAKRDPFWDRKWVITRWRKNWAEALNSKLRERGLETVSHRAKDKASQSQPNKIENMRRRGEFPNQASLKPGKISEEVLHQVKGKNLVQLLVEDGWQINARKTTKQSISMKRDDRAVVVSNQGGHYIYFETDSKVKNGTAIDYLIHERNLNFREAVAWLQQWDSTESAPVIQAGQKRPTNFFKIYNNLPNPEYSKYLNYRGLSKETYSSPAFQGKFKTRGSTVLFPHYRGSYEIPGVEMRGYQIKKFWKNSERTLWNSNVLDANNPNKTLYIAESPIDAMSFAQYKGLSLQDGSSIFAATSGSISPSQLELLKQVAKSHPWLGGIRIIFDNDGPGRKMADGLEQALRKVTATDIHQELPFMEGYDWNKMLTMGPVGYITQQTTHSKMFGNITAREGKALHAEKADTIFIFQNTQSAWQEALTLAKRKGWEKVEVYGPAKHGLS